ncbi:substrate-binding domain-containing protein [Paenibacillus mendelii]|uniref:Substrate-binding domain-containing protein n=1 Tax=Paenibacillus mendelii TaxID=206163 RepID=A0ABV6JB98_9BACL|nr:substrate-binding domain-containing protein [Paenibacillus mendelii]MCQ6562963.1 substrate-binding domain-containing protein [Paenibacillus mendelii]
MRESEVLNGGQIEGIIVIEGIDTKLYSSLKKRYPHLVGIDVSDPTIPTISYDRIEAARIAVNHLVDQGHRDILFIGGTGRSGEFEREKRYRGYKLALDQAGLPLKFAVYTQCPVGAG